MRVQGWMILRDTATLVEAAARTMMVQLRWDARVVELDSIGKEKLLGSQKPFLKFTRA